MSCLEALLLVPSCFYAATFASASSRTSAGTVPPAFRSVTPSKRRVCVDGPDAHIIDEMGSMRDDMQVLNVPVMRLDGTVGLVLTELRAMHSQHSRLANRVRRLEEQRDEPK